MVTFAADHSASGVWHLHQAVRLHNPRWFIQPPAGLDHRVGAYGGLLIERDGDIVLGVLDDPVLGLLSFGPTNPALAPGAYHVSVLGDAATRFSIPFAGLSQNIRVQLDGRSTASRSASTASLSPALPVGYADQRVITAHKRAMVVGVAVNTTSSQADVLHACLGSQSLPCEAQPGTDTAEYSGVNPGVLGSGGAVAWSSYLAPALPATPAYAVVDVATVSVQDSAVLVVASFD
jgi:hypothetical protein